MKLENFIVQIPPSYRGRPSLDCGLGDRSLYRRAISCMSCPFYRGTLKLARQYVKRWWAIVRPNRILYTCIACQCAPIAMAAGQSGHLILGAHCRLIGREFERCLTIRVSRASSPTWVIITRIWAWILPARVVHGGWLARIRSTWMTGRCC